MDEFEENRRRLARWARRRLPATAADEITDDALALAFFRAADSGDRPSLAALAFRIARHLIADWHRHRRNRKTAPLPDPLDASLLGMSVDMSRKQVLRFDAAIGALARSQ